ncbi:uncharacterized protein LOC104435348 [Eucalyptus grandis]|uniref:uncharacterized protein LOC104435348 n=1 Tax=Eucalyptus grandis TaxID=71139 RepID=UPI00192EB8AB|nr:uncharacterized protein LOC104435348 [Eucalyptus grandis]
MLCSVKAEAVAASEGDVTTTVTDRKWKTYGSAEATEQRRGRRAGCLVGGRPARRLGGGRAIRACRELKRRGKREREGERFGGGEIVRAAEGESLIARSPPAVRPRLTPSNDSRPRSRTRGSHSPRQLSDGKGLKITSQFPGPTPPISVAIVLSCLLRPMVTCNYWSGQGGRTQEKKKKKKELTHVDHPMGATEKICSLGTSAWLTLLVLRLIILAPFRFVLS